MYREEGDRREKKGGKGKKERRKGIKLGREKEETEKDKRGDER